MKGPRQSPFGSDIEYGNSKSEGDEDNSKYKRPHFLLVWRRYSRGFSFLGLVFCLVYLLYLGVVYVGSNMDEPLSVSESIPDSFKLMIVADLDKDSRVKDDKKGKWRSILKKGELRRDLNGSFSIHWLEDQEIFTKFSEAGRGMELSALLSYHNQLYAFDDRTGLVFELVKGNKAIPRFILMEGKGDTTKGQKTEWATVKDDKIYAGSFGKEFTLPDGSIANTNNMWVSVIDRDGVVTHENWTTYYNLLRQALGVEYPGYMIHEAIAWSEHRKQWVILPRRVSKEPYDEKLDEQRGSNYVLLASEDFKSISVLKITTLTPSRGFSEFKFLPGSKDSIIVAMKSEESEKDHSQNTYITVFSLDGTILMEETEIPGNHKFEGLEFFYFCFCLFKDVRGYFDETGKDSLGHFFRV